MNWASWAAVVCADAHYGLQGVMDGAKVGSFLGPQGATAGAIAGGVVFAASGSFIQYVFQKHVVTRADDDELPPIPSLEEVSVAYAASVMDISDKDYQLGATWGIADENLKMGILHNKALGKLGKPTTSSDLKAYENLPTEDKNIIESSIFEQMYAENMTYDNVCGGEGTRSITTLASTELSTEQNKIMTLFLNGIKDSVLSQQELNRFIGMYATVVGRSRTLTDLEKQGLLTCFAVAGYSFAYWSEVWPYEPSDDDIDEGIM